MITETAAATLERAIGMDAAIRRTHSPSQGVIVAPMDGSMESPKFLTIDDVAARLKLSPWTVKDHHRKGILRASRLNRRVRVSEEQFNDYIDRLRTLGRGESLIDRAETIPTDDELERTLLDLIDSGRLDSVIAAAARRGGA